MRTKKSNRVANDFSIGSKIICINDDFSNLPPLYKLIFKFPAAHGVYSIRAKDYDGNLFLNEIINEVYTFPHGAVAEPSFLKWRFKPLCLDEMENTEVKEELLTVNKCLFMNTIQEMDIRSWFSQLSDNQKLSLFMKRVNSNEATIFDGLLQSWWINRY